MALLHLSFALRWLLFVTLYLWLAICYLLSVYFYLKLAITCKNLFLSLVVVRLVIFSYCLTIHYFGTKWQFSLIKHTSSFNSQQTGGLYILKRMSDWHQTGCKLKGSQKISLSWSIWGFHEGLYSPCGIDIDSSSLNFSAKFLQSSTQTSTSTTTWVEISFNPH